MERVIGLLDAIPYLRAYGGQTFVVKAGGDLLKEPAWRDAVARDVCVLHRLGIRVILVHGGGPQLDALAQRLDIHSERVAGRRITSPALIDAAKMEWRGKLSLDWVTAIHALGEAAVGLSGADGAVVAAEKRPPALVTDDDGKTRSVDFGLVGDICSINAGVFDAIAKIPAIPVVSPLAVDTNGQILNVNADTVAAEIAVATKAAKLVLLTQTPGILENVNDPSSVLHWTDLVELAELERDGKITGGMRPKCAAIRRALQGGVPRVHVVDGRRQGALLEEVFTPDGSGTLVVAEADQAPSEPVSPWR